MARRNRTFQWRGDDVEEVVRVNRDPLTPEWGRLSGLEQGPRKPAKMGMQTWLLMFTVCSVVLVFAVPTLIAVLALIYSVIFG